MGCFASLGEEFGSVVCLEVRGVVVADCFDVGFDAEAFADCFEASFEGELGGDGVVFFEVGFCEAGFAAGVGVSFEGDVEAFAQADARVDAFFDEVAFALDA